MVLMVTLSFGVLVSRWLFQSGHIAWQEAYLWLHALLFLLGAVVAAKDRAHVRIEIFDDLLGGRCQRMVELGGHVLLLLPMMFVIIWSAWQPVWRSFALLEGSPLAGGLPGLFLLKSMVLVMAVSLVLFALRRVCEITARSHGS